MEAPAAPGGLGWDRETAALALVSFAMLIVSLDQYIVVVALPGIAADVGYSARTLRSVISAYAVASAGFLLFGGRAAGLLGRRRILATGLALYAGAALAGGSRPVAGRCLAPAPSRASAGPWSSPPPWR
jgi:MFS family permease